MRLRNIPAELAPSVVNLIDRRLADIAQTNRVRIVLAIESGSRAWGFPSPDSDYDCRFIFMRSLDQYLSPWQRRDVIETPLDPVLDINGWELGKALKLLLKGNAVFLEWLQSPIVYDGDAAFRSEMLQFARDHTERSLIGRHYLHLGERQQRVYFGDGKDVPLKKIFYALRPAATLRWLRLRPAQSFAPMHFPTLISECEPPPDVASIVDDLMHRKAVTRELGSAALPEPIRAFIDSEFDQARLTFGDRRITLSPTGVMAAEELFRRYVQG